jgi:hypothetical protein
MLPLYPHEFRKADLEQFVPKPPGIRCLVRFREASRVGWGRVSAPVDIGPISRPALIALQRKPLNPGGCAGAKTVSLVDFEDAEPVIAPKEAEHRLMIEPRFPKWPIG